MPASHTLERVQKLPPLILHPFSDSSSPSRLLQGSRASLMMHNVLPNEEFTLDQLQEMLIDGKVCEIRMLYYVGKDLLRWIEQCVETLRRDREPFSDTPDARSMAAYLIDETPLPVQEKLRAWGVQDFKAIFARAIGLNHMFGDAPERDTLAEEFVRNYHYYTDQLYSAWLNAQEFVRVPAGTFDFQLYASAEYSNILASQWSDD